MVFSDPLFIFVFLPFFLFFYLIISAEYLNLFICIASLLFYYIGEPKYFWVLLAVIVINYTLGVIIDSFLRPQTALLKQLINFALPALYLGITLDLGILLYFKYLSFFTTSLNSALSTLGLT